MHRRRFLRTLTHAAVVVGLPSVRAAPARKAPFRILYSNDATNVLSCTSPWHAKGASFRPSMLEASVDEVAGTGVDAHLLQPRLGWVPLWPSKVYPVEEHYRWLKDAYGLGSDSLGRFVLGGGDLVKVFVDRCRARGQAPFISFRLNDVHHKDQALLQHWFLAPGWNNPFIRPPDLPRKLGPGQRTVLGFHRERRSRVWPHSRGQDCGRKNHGCCGFHGSKRRIGSPHP